MTRVVWNKRREASLEDWEGDPAKLVGHEEELMHDYVLCERVFYSKQEAFAAGWALAGKAPDPAPPAVASDSEPVDLYARSDANRRVTFLELVAWAIAQIEGRSTSSADLYRFERTLISNREEGWHQQPWRGASKDEAEFERYVLGLARSFTGSGDTRCASKSTRTP